MISFKRSLIVALCSAMIAQVELTVSCAADSREEIVSLNGTWNFRLDPDDKGIAEKWFTRGSDAFLPAKARIVRVPHTWQVEPGSQDYYGVAWYQTIIMAESDWNSKTTWLEFDAAYRDVTVWVEGARIGEHIGSGWTPFRFAVKNWNMRDWSTIVVRVDNRFSENALPYKKSSDWAADGGIIRSVRVRVLPSYHIASIQVHAEPYTTTSPKEPLEANVELVGSGIDEELVLLFDVIGPTGRRVAGGGMPIKTGPDGKVTAHWTNPKFNPDPQDLWHFDQPRLFRLVCTLRRGDTVVHRREATFGIRKIEVRDGRFWLNGEPMRLMGVEWMPGSDPRYGMAEDPRVAREILTDMKRLNCIITRFHWQQDDSVFDFCNREGMLVQEEIPAWGGETMRGSLDAVQEMQTREMILAHYNYPSIFAWGLCNEIGGQSREAHRFVGRGRDLARALDPHRLLTYASNSLQKNPERDAVGLLDFIEWNEYYESWYGGGVPDVEANLKRIHDALSTKTVVVSEYGLCECTPKNPVGDPRRIEILRTHTDGYRKAPWVAGSIFFDYNDYRTHIGDKGQGEFRQRVHGVVDLFGRRKPSWEALRRECSPIKSLTVADPAPTSPTTRALVEIVTRRLEDDFPSYTLRGYQLVWIAYNDLGQPIGTGRRVLKDLPPGTRQIETIEWPTFEPLRSVRVEVFRPTGYSVIDAEWKSAGP